MLEIVRTIHDPEHPYTLQEIKVVREADIQLVRFGKVHLNIISFDPALFSMQTIII